jgi:hypothetical protein
MRLTAMITVKQRKKAESDTVITDHPTGKDRYPLESAKVCIHIALNYHCHHQVSICLTLRSGHIYK